MSILRTAFILSLAATIVPATVAAGATDARVDRAVHSAQAGGAGRVSITNPNGSITVTGTDGGSVRVTMTDQSSGEKTTLPVDAVASAGLDIRPPARTMRGREVTLDVELPRSGDVTSIVAGSGDVNIHGVTSALQVRCDSGNVRATGIGALQLKAGSGDVLVEDSTGSVFVEAGSGSVTARGVKGDLVVRSGSGDVRVERSGALVDATVASGEVVLADVAGDVRIAAISGDVHVDRVTGAVEVGNASGSIYLTTVGGDIDVKTASGDAIVTAEVTGEHKYRIKSMSGDAVLNVCGEPSGFTATLASYSGDMETAFPLNIDGTSGSMSRRVVGRFGNGAAQIQIEAFSGSARIAKCRPAANK